MDGLDPRQNGGWKVDLLGRLATLCRDTPFEHAVAARSQAGIHLAIFVEPYLGLLLEGKKTVESRFSINRHPPFERVKTGDILIVKKAGGPVCGICKVANVWFYRLNPRTWPEIERHAEALCMDGSSFWEKKKAASFATLMQVEDVLRVEEFAIYKEDPRSWVVIRPTPPAQQGALF